ncbi:hypothetical protein DFH11DRAFT_1626755 [Phellopilus nigrolimitatus]|nr:hypothetical protein DFH11DRAFT_1626755 [Phellopilus nigrolimitatus]
MKKYSSFDVNFGADDIGENGTVQLGEDTRFTVNLVFGASRPLQDVARLLSKEATTALAFKVVLLDNIDKILEFSEKIMGFVEVVAELNPIAELVVKALKAAHENCQKISGCHNDAIALMGEMVSLICLPELVNDKIKEPATKEVMYNFLVLAKDAADALTEYASPSGISFYARNWFKPKWDSFAKLRQRFTAVKQNMDLYLGASTYLVQMLDRLHPVLKAHYDPDHSCLQGTRADILHDICDWAISHQDPQTKLFWLYGIAGSGKSSIASSVASSLDQQGCLAGCFFFKRDIPECRSPQHFVSTLAYYIARACKPFRDVMLQVLQDDPDIASKAVRLQFETLFTGPLPKSSQLSSPKPLVMIIDALDECQDAGSVSAYLAQLAGLTSWLKIFVTSRPLPEIEKGLYPAITFMRKFDLYHANAHSDIFQYTRTWLLQVIGNDDANFVEEKALALTKKASGLFIHQETAIS